MKEVLLCLIFPFIINAQTAFINGNDTICDNGDDATINVYFNGSPPFSFIYSINGNIEDSIINTHNNPYYIKNNQEGMYILEQFNDVFGVGTVSGSGLVTLLESPTAIIHLQSDTLSTIYPIANFISQSIGNIVSWDWDFGDGAISASNFNVSHQYQSSIAIYQASLIVIDNNGCSDTASKVVFVINSESEDESYWMWIPSSFTPDKDDENERFCIEYNSIRENTFLLKVLNSQGDLMYQSTNPSEMKCSNFGGWDGKHYLTNKDLPSDTYIYDIYFQEQKGWKHQEYGTIILVR